MSSRKEFQAETDEMMRFPPEFDDYISIRLFKNANMSQSILQKVQR